MFLLLLISILILSPFLSPLFTLSLGISPKAFFHPTFLLLLISILILSPFLSPLFTPLLNGPWDFSIAVSGQLRLARGHLNSMSQREDKRYFFGVGVSWVEYQFHRMVLD